VDLSGWVGVGLGGNCDCRLGNLYAPMLGERVVVEVVFAGLVRLTFSFFFLGRYIETITHKII